MSFCKIHNFTLPHQIAMRQALLLDGPWLNLAKSLPNLSLSASSEAILTPAPMEVCALCL